MIRFLLKRPIAVFITTAIFSIFGLLALFNIPVSLLPAIDIPKILIKISYPNSSAVLIEENITRTIRDNMQSMSGVVDINSSSLNYSSIVELDFEYGTNMSLASVEVNERIDRLLEQLPNNLERPQVVRINTSDVPIVRVQVTPKEGTDYLNASRTTEKAIKKRLEQVKGVSLVDMNGMSSNVISIIPNRQALLAAGISQAQLTSTIASANFDLGEIMVKDGNYRYFVKLNNEIQTKDQIEEIPVILKGNKTAKVSDFAQIIDEVSEPNGFHIFNGQRGLVLTIHKQDKARMNDLLPALKKSLSVFKKDYPELTFSLTQDQTFLLNDGIDNLNQDLWYGAAFCIILLFLLLGNYITPLIMGISIPLSLLLTFIFFYLFKISFNIISLSGLALGIGMLIDNSIVVIDSITRNRSLGHDIEESCVLGVNDVLSPVISNVLTTIAIYAPLVLLSGLAGQLIYDQAIALTISLLVSLIVAFCLNPVMFKFFINEEVSKLRQNTIIYEYIYTGYAKMISYVFKRKKVFIILTLSIMPLGFMLFYSIPMRALPKLTETETLLNVEWNEQISAQDGVDRLSQMVKILKTRYKFVWEAEVGLTAFVLSSENKNIDRAEVYLKMKTPEEKLKIDREIRSFLRQNYRMANFDMVAAPNAFTQLFEKKEPFMEIRLRPLNNSHENIQPLYQGFLNGMQNYKFEVGSEFANETGIEMDIDMQKLATLDVDRNTLEEELERSLGIYNITEIKNFGNSKQVKLRAGQELSLLNLNSTVENRNGINYSIASFIKFNYTSNPKLVKADRFGEYKSISLSKDAINDLDNFISEMKELAAKNNLNLAFHGSYSSNRIMMKELFYVFLISVLMLYFILALQFENLIHPLIVMLTIPLGVGGASALLWLAGGTLDIMAAIGFIVVLGIIVDDPSLKVETINRLRREYENNPNLDREEGLLLAIKEAGKICLKPLLMVSLTTSLALVPVLFSDGLGNELQKPLVYVIIGGVTIGTLFTLWFIPLAYWFVTSKHRK